MSHEIEIIDGVPSHAYVGDKPWHNLGFELKPGCTPDEMLTAAHLDWTVIKIPGYATVNGEQVSIGRSALVRSSDLKVLDVVGSDWNPTQNKDAFDFFSEFVNSASMTMETAGSLKGGQIVWGLAKIDGQAFEAVKGDRIDSYLLFVNPHKFGKSIDIRFTPIRVVCNNTLTLSLNTKSSNMVTVSHRRKFNAAEVKEVLGLSKVKLDEYSKMAKLLAAKKFTNQTVNEYFDRVFPVASTTDTPHKIISANAALAKTVLETQPGAKYARGTWWQASQTITYLTDFKFGRSVDARMTSAWFGANKTLKLNALKLAVDYAQAA